MSDPGPPTPLRALAHELRNAIAPVRNAAHLLRKRAATDPIVATALETIDNAVAESLRLLDDAVDAEGAVQRDVAAVPAAQDAPSREAKGDGPPRVLLVDDNRAVRESYADVLADLGCEVETAADGEQAIARAVASKPRFVVLDVNLPKRNGYEVARTLREQFAPGEMTIVMLSGAVLDAATIASAHAAGFDHCLDKATDLDALRRLLEG